MTLKHLLTAAAFASVGTFAFAESHADPIAARQEAMKTIGAQMKTLTQMSKGQMDFDAMTAQAALTTMAETAETVPALFETEAVDPESDASDDIWQNWDDFVSKAEALQTAASGAATSVDSMETLGAAMGAVGGACGACHKPYKL